MNKAMNEFNLKPVYVTADEHSFAIELSAKNYTNNHSTEQATEQAIVEFCNEPKTTNEIMLFLGLKHREHFRAKILKPLLENGLLQLTIPDKPKSPNQKHVRIKNEEAVSRLIIGN